MTSPLSALSSVIVLTACTAPYADPAEGGNKDGEEALAEVELELVQVPTEYSIEAVQQWGYENGLSEMPDLESYVASGGNVAEAPTCDPYYDDYCSSSYGLAPLAFIVVGIVVRGVGFYVLRQAAVRGGTRLAVAVVSRQSVHVVAGPTTQQALVTAGLTATAGAGVLASQLERAPQSEDMCSASTLCMRTDTGMLRINDLYHADGACGWERMSDIEAQCFQAAGDCARLAEVMERASKCSAGRKLGSDLCFAGDLDAGHADELIWARIVWETCFNQGLHCGFGDQYEVDQKRDEAEARHRREYYCR